MNLQNRVEQYLESSVCHPNANVPVRHVNAGSWTHQWNEVKVNRKWIKVDAYGGIFADTTGIRKSLRTSAEEQEQLVFHFTIER